jgi:hypothetical protein
MRRHVLRFRAVWLLAALATGCTVALVSCGPGVDGQPEQSPVSPVTAFPWAPPPEPVSSLDWITDELFWTSPLPWVAIGLILFSGLAWVLVRTLRTGGEREEHPRPPRRAP